MCTRGVGGYATFTVLSILLSSCSLGPGPTPAPTSQRLLHLESAHRDHPTAASVAALLAAAYLHDGRVEEAREVLAAGRTAMPDDQEIVFLQGLAEEAAGNDEDAIALYRSYATVAPRQPYALEAEGRADRLGLAELDASASNLVAREEQISAARPDLTRIAMIPLVPDRRDPRAEPLARSMAELMPVMMTRNTPFEGIDPSRVRALVSALGLTEAELEDTDTAERIGRLLGAGTVISGTFAVLDDLTARISVNVMLLGPSRTRSVVAFDSVAQMAQLSMVNRRLARLAADHAGVPWTPQVRRRFEVGASARTPAWLFFGQGLMAFEDGDYGDAAGLFEEALRLDRGFAVARERATRARYLQVSTEPPGALAWRAAQVGQQRQAVLTLMQEPGSAHRRLQGALANDGRAALAELLGQDRVGTGAVIELIFPSGGGGGQ